MEDRRQRLFSGSVVVEVCDRPGEIDRHHENWALWAESEDEALGHAVRASMDKHKNGKVVTAAMYDITAAALMKMNWR